MKLNLEVELDFIDEQMSLDETVKQNIINGVVEKIQAKVEKQVTEKIENAINETTEKRINQLTDSLFADFMNRPVTLRDPYGRDLKCYDNVEAIIKERFDNFMTQTVDEEGNTTTSNYGRTMPRVTFVIQEQLTRFANQFTTDAVKKVSAEIQEHVKDGLTQKLGTELMKVLKVEKLLAIDK